MRKGGITALFCAFRLEYNHNIKKFLQADLIFLCTALFLCTAIFLHTIFLHAGLISTSTQVRRCVLP